MAKVKISKVEPKENELAATKVLEKDIDIKAIERGKAPVKATKSKTTKTAASKAKTTTRKTTTKKTKEQEIGE